MGQVNIYGPERTVKMIICNKIDLADKRVVTREDGLALAEKHSAIYFETTAKDYETINEAFSVLVTNLRKT